ncbi:hypothetical protein [Streptacidiphilus melanogenes]|uniref:hypothetical protein n=1 Tax=Streptacidiphilus melanogenes TaxID=411235 RepID=UPI0005AA2D16|nr:hypothetical protein [Streptacidiphilus melanogenes]
MTPGEGATGLPNPEADGTPGTAYRRFDETTREYLFAAAADGSDWATYERRRYTEPMRDDGYGLDCRYDWRDGVYEWRDETTGRWRDQEWADRRSAPARPDSTAAGDGEPDAYWDANLRMFYRILPDGSYEYADAVAAGDESSGCGDRWLSHRQVLLRAARTEPTASSPDADQP